jgi:crossover junction endodeoxyribonuclease RusA
VTGLAFTVHGEPAPQGSKTTGRTKAGATFMREDNPNTEPWRNAVALRALAAMNGQQPFAGPLRLDVTFVFARPRSHYRTGKHAGQLKPSAPVHCDKRPDLDKLVRAIGDALTGTAIIDDAAITELVARKHYGAPGAHIVVDELSPHPTVPYRKVPANTTNCQEPR